MQRATTQTLYDPRNGDLALAVEDLALGPGAGPPTRTNTFHVDWLQDGQGQVWADCACHPFQAPALVFSVPYQYRRYVVERSVRGVRVEFHAVADGVHVRETFDAETVHDVEMQRRGWQAILDNFARHVEAGRPGVE